MMLYRVQHTTTYKYHETVPICHNLAMLTPRDTYAQRCKSFTLDVTPLPKIIEEYVDFFGNKVYYFIIEEEHEKLIVTSTSTIEKKSAVRKVNLPSLESWERVRDMLEQSNGDFIDVKQFVIPSEITAPFESIIQYTLPSFHQGQSLFDSISDLMSRIYEDFKYSSGFTTISTPLSIVMEERKGVCQDFAHLAIACIQSMGLAARYVSGYLETNAPPGKEKLNGADASHAWFSVFIPEMGWIDFDPTNNKIPDDQYITIGWGRNYFDIIPLRGVIMSTNPHQLSISVDVTRII